MFNLECIKRITSDLKDFLKSGFKTMFVEAEEDDITHVQALLLGPEGTPYAFGFFHFDLLFPSNYPWKSPKVQLITTDNGQCRFSKCFFFFSKEKFFNIQCCSFLLFL